MAAMVPSGGPDGVDDLVQAFCKHATKSQLKCCVWTITRASRNGNDVGVELEHVDGVAADVNDRLEAARPHLTNVVDKIKRNVALHPEQACTAHVSGQDILHANGSQLRQWQRKNRKHQC